MTRRAALTLLSAGLSPALQAAAGTVPVWAPPRGCRQLLRVESRGWKATTGTLTLWARDKAGAPWHLDGPPISITLGRNGLRWGRGLHAAAPGVAVKQEGDGCSPAGIFSLGIAFGQGTAKQAGVGRWPWEPMTPAHAGVDDPASRHYNRIVDSRRVKKDWLSAENMVPASGVYRLGLVVRHNADRQPGAGSCIFLHLRTAPDHPTSGCTAMDPASLSRVLRWLDSAKHPLLVQLPKSVWQTQGPLWSLPMPAAAAARLR